MIVVMQLIFCTVRDFLKAITSKSIEHEIKEENNVLDLKKESPAPKKRRVVCNFSMSPADCHKVHKEQAENTCEHKYLNVISERNPSVSKEFLENLERRTANRSDTLQLAQLSHKTENTEKNKDNSEVCSTWCEQSHNVDGSSQKAEEVTERFDTEEPPKRFPATLLSDRDWLDEFEYLFAAGLLDELKETLKRSFDENKNPFDFILFIMTFADHDIFSGKKSLVHIALTEFESWIENENKRMGETGRELLMPTKEQQDSALEIVVSSKLLFFETIKRLYKLDCGDNQFLEKHIRYLLSTGRRYKEAATFATKLNLQTQFEPSEMLLPLLILDKLQLAESYIMSSVWHQRAYLSMIDDLCGMEDEQLQQIVDSANIYPKPKENKLKNKILVKIGERLIKKFHLNGEDYPNVFKEKNLSGLRYLLNKKYTERNAPPKKWDNLIESAIGFNVWLQERLIESLVEYKDVNEAVRWANYYGLPLESVPPVVQEAIIEMEQSVERDVEDWDDPYQEYNHTTPDPPYKETPLPVHQLTLPFEKIIFVDDEWGLTECLSKISKPGTTLGFDAEWRPTMCRVESNEKLATIQLATRTEVFILDMIAILDNVDEDLLQKFGKEVFSNPTVLKLGYSCEGDFQIMMTSCPQWKDALTNVKRFVDVCPLSKQILDLPQVKKKVKSFRESRQLRRFDMERGLSELVMLCLGKPLDKTYQVSDWERRPLLAEQLVYAALDAYCLLEVYTVLHQWVKESRTYVNMEPELYLSSLGADKKKKSRNGNRMKHPKPGTLGMRLTAPVNTDNPISPRQLSIVVDTMLQGLGRNLRCCGVDVNILSTGTSHEDAAKVAIQENRILLTSGTPYYSLRSKVPEGMCLCVPVGTVKEQVVEIFRHFNVRVTSQDIFSRCQICNGNRYIQVIPDHMKLAHHIMKNPDLLDNIPLPVDCPIDYQTLTLKETGVPLKLGLLTDNAWKRKIDVFYCCAMCGKIFWEGSHFAKVQEQFAHLLDSS